MLLNNESNGRRKENLTFILRYADVFPTHVKQAPSACIKWKIYVVNVFKTTCGIQLLNTYHIYPDRDVFPSFCINTRHIQIGTVLPIQNNLNMSLCFKVNCY